MAHKVWAVGEEVLAPDFQTYTQNQVIETFPSAADRNTYLSAPKNGQTVWLEDAKALEVWDGTAWRPIHPKMPYGATQGATGAGGTTLSTSYVGLPVALTRSFTKVRGDTTLRYDVRGHLWLDDALSNAYVGVKLDAAAAVDVDSVSSLDANESHTIAGIGTSGTATAGAHTLTVQWKVSSGAKATQVGKWTLYIFEEFFA